MTRKTLTIADYSVFFGMLAVSSLIGIYFAWRDRRQQTTQMFLVGGRRLGVLPVTMSLIASYYSPNTVLGYPSDIYSHGTQYMVILFLVPISIIIASEVFLPVFYNMQITSVNTYLLRRFNSEIVRLAGSLSIVLSAVPHLAIVLYGPSLALGAVTDLSVNTSVILISAVCTFYTAIGGIKAVIWTDVIQLFMMFLGMMALVVQGTILVGGVENVWTISDQGGRIEFFNFRADLYSVYTFWNVVFGVSVRQCAAYAVDQMQIQRTCSMPTLKQAKLVLYLLIPGVIIITLLAGFSGLLMYAYYSECDPLKRGFISKKDQILPYFVMETMSQTPGFAGIFIACVFSSSLSTLSSGLNSLAAITWEDFIHRLFKTDTRYDVWITKLIAVLYGGVVTGMAFTISRLSSILQASLAISGSQLGPKFGLYFMGIMFPFCNAKGVLIGMVAGEVLCLWLIVATLMYPRPSTALPVSTMGCLLNNTLSDFTPTSEFVEGEKITMKQYIPTGIYKFYHLSPMLFALFGFFVTVVVGVIASLITGGWTKYETDPEVINPLALKIWKFFKKEKEGKRQDVKRVKIEENYPNEDATSPEAIPLK